MYGGLRAFETVCEESLRMEKDERRFESGERG